MDHLAPYPFPEPPPRIHAPDEERKPMDVTIQAFEGFGLARYVGAATFRARDANEAAYIHLLVKAEDWAKEGPQGKEWYERLLGTLREPLDWSAEPRIQTNDRHDPEPSIEGYTPHPTNHSAFERSTKPKLPKPTDSKRPGLSLAENAKKQTPVVLKSRVIEETPTSTLVGIKHPKLEGEALVEYAKPKPAIAKPSIAKPAATKKAVVLRVAIPVARKKTEP